MHPGFFLIECLLYSCLVGILAVAVMRGVVPAMVSLRKHSAYAQRSAAISAAHNLLVRDLQRSPANKQYWREISPTRIVWTQEGHDYCWCFEDGKLFHIQTEYAHATKPRRTKSLTLEHIKEGTFDITWSRSPSGQECIAMITVNSTSSMPDTTIKTVHTNVVPRQRECS